MKNLAASEFDTWQEFKSEIFYSLNCHRIGTIQSFDATTQTANIKLIDKRLRTSHEGSRINDYALLVDCPVYIHSGGGGWINQPISEGDECLVLFNDRDIDNWFASGAPSVPETRRAHSLQDGFAIVGFHSKLKKLTSLDATSYGVNYQGAKIQISSAGKIDIQNNGGDLKTLINNLIQAIQNLKAVNGASQYPIDSTTSSALSSLTTQFSLLLK